MELHTIDFNFEGITVIWRFRVKDAPYYLIEVVTNSSTRTFKTSKAPTVNNARKFAES